MNMSIWLIYGISLIVGITVTLTTKAPSLQVVKIFEDCYINKIKYLTLEVRVSNEAAIGLYTKYGFSSLGTRKGYYQDNNEDALIMWTENIFYDKFKIRFDKNKTELEKLIKYYD